MPRIVGVLLAAGIGQRFDPTGARLKLLAPFPADSDAGVPIAAAAARSLRAAVAEVVAVVRPATSDAQRRLHLLLAAEGCRLVVCESAGEGMGASLACGVRAAADADGWIVALADMPAVQPSTIDAIAAALMRGAETAAPFFDGRRGHPVGFSRACGAELLALSGDHGARGVLQTHRLLPVDVDDPGCLFDIDTPAP
jgi:molybdenum cofactor cytidylyltransferase